MNTLAYALCAVLAAGIMFLNFSGILVPDSLPEEIVEEIIEELVDEEIDLSQGSDESP